MPENWGYPEGAAGAIASWLDGYRRMVMILAADRGFDAFRCERETFRDGIALMVYSLAGRSRNMTVFRFIDSGFCGRICVTAR